MGLVQGAKKREGFHSHRGGVVIAFAVSLRNLAGLDIAIESKG